MAANTWCLLPYSLFGVYIPSIKRSIKFGIFIVFTLALGKKKYTEAFLPPRLFVFHWALVS